MAPKQKFLRCCNSETKFGCWHWDRLLLTTVSPCKAWEAWDGGLMALDTGLDTHSLGTRGFELWITQRHSLHTHDLAFKLVSISNIYLDSHKGLELIKYWRFIQPKRVRAVLKILKILNEDKILTSCSLIQDKSNNGLIIWRFIQKYMYNSQS